MTVILIAASLWDSLRSTRLRKLYHGLSDVGATMMTHQIRLSLTSGAYAVTSLHSPLKRTQT